jgi:2-dehydropantoate 2-reductase
MSPTPASLSIAIIGVGRIGSAFAYQLSRAGHRVTVVARPGSERLEQLRRDGGIVTVEGERAAVTIAEQLDEQEPYDLVIVTTLAHQVEAVLPGLQRSAAKQIHFMFVTLEYKTLGAAVGEQRATFGMAAVLSVLDGNGKLKLEIPKTKAMQGDEHMVEILQAAGMPAKYEPEMGRWLRSQVPLTIAMTSVTGTGMQHPKGATFAEARVGARGLRAAFGIIKGQGETPYPNNKKQMSGMPLPVLTFILRAVSRSHFRETVGNSAEETRGLIDLLTAEAGNNPALREDTDAVRALRPQQTAKISA